MGAPVVHFEIGCKDKQKTADFYSRLFGWKTQAYGDMATMIDTAAGGAGIAGHISAMGHEPHNYVVFYAAVDDLAASIKAAEKLGGKAMVPPTEVPGMGSFAWVKDPEGTIVGLWKALAK